MQSIKLIKFAGQKHIIVHMSYLWFLDYITNDIEVLKQTRNNFHHKALVSEFSGGKYRRVSIEIIVHNAFENVKTN